MDYRPEIDGLRAIAVLPVILFHAGIAGFAGGFVGVDIFFVLSGYLITTILWNDLEAGKFTFKKFYERRIRRILPALIFVILCTLVVGWFWLTPQQFGELGTSSTLALYSVSNFHFYGQSGYFAQASETQPLLHTWSLAVEEQFYLLFPIALLWLHRLSDRRRTSIALAIVALGSLVLCEYLWRVDPDANFFLIPSRAWELMAGALCALYLHGRTAKGNDVVAAMGLLMIGLSVVLFDETTPFPSLATLLPIGGTVLVVLFATDDNRIARLLSTRVLVGLGLISYSAYLWHQPIFAFVRLRMGYEPSAAAMLALSALTILLAILSWKFVERPFRRQVPQVPRKPQWSGVPAVLATLLVVAGLGTIISTHNGLPARFDPARVAQYEASRALSPEMRPCKVEYVQTDPAFCRHGMLEDPEFKVALIGDSHASQWTYALAKEAEQRGWQLDTYAKSSCALAGIEYYLPSIKRDYVECPLWRANLFGMLAKQDYDVVIGTQSSISYLHRHGSGSVSYGRWETGMIELTQTLDTLPGRWILLSDNPQFRRNSPPDCVAKAFLMDLGELSACDEEREFALDKPARAIERRLANDSARGSWFDLSDLMCDERACRPQIDGALLMSDTNHLSTFGTQLGASSLADAIEVSAAQQEDATTAIRHAFLR